MRCTPCKGDKKLKGSNKEAFQSLETKAVSDSLKLSFIDDFGTKSVVLFRTIRPETVTGNFLFCTRPQVLLCHMTNHKLGARDVSQSHCFFLFPLLPLWMQPNWFNGLLPAAPIDMIWYLLQLWQSPIGFASLEHSGSSAWQPISTTHWNSPRI